MKDNALYLEVDEDITSAIDKLGKSQASSVQIVVPKRSTMLQSIINLKLLKKAAEANHKELILVTNDRIATELASRVGLPVAPSLGASAHLAQAKLPEELKSHEEIIEADEPDIVAKSDGGQPQPAPAADKPSSRLPLLKRKEVSDTPPPPAPSAVEPKTEPAAGPEAVPTGGKSKPPKVPNFKRLQRRALWLLVGIFLIGGYFIAMYFLSSAKVTLYANGTKVDIDTTFSADPSAKQTDLAKGVLSAQTVSVSKDLSGPFTPTGKKDAGTKASGTMTISNCLDNSTHNFVAGTRFQAPDGKVFRSNEDISVPGGQGSFFGCTTPGTATVTVTADQNGDGYNEAAATYTIPGLSASQQTGHNAIIAKGEQMAGGTTKTITVVTDSDVDAAKTALLAKDKDNATRDLQGKVPTGYVALSGSQTQTTDSATPSPALDSEATTATLSLKVTYSILTVKDKEYHDLVRAQEQKQIGDKNQVYDDGIGTAQITLGDADSAGRRTIHLTTTAFAGTKLDTADIANQVKGKRYGDASDIASRLPGVTRSEISIWPGWGTNLPGRPGKIKVTIQVAGNKD